KTVRTLTWNPYDRIVRTNKNERQAARISEHFATSSVI
ncbi:unnamed protein product, partial [Rotaria socialis]